ncbi:trypsin-like peptidase domain-containing protein [Streptomyces phaeochromogenes]|uniref:effector-associated domain 2-containing protein n=1 Tax=Streptomyces phaeochromogenes TaxID=1923 RepID=UPI0036D07386
MRQATVGSGGGGAVGELDAATAGRLRICSPDGLVYGGGLLLNRTTALTCAHVVAAALSLDSAAAGRACAPQGRVLVDHSVATGHGEPGTAEVAEGSWFVSPLQGGGETNPALRMDFAVLTLQRPVPPGAPSAVLGSCPAPDGRILRVLGYPKQAAHGIWVSARLIGTGGPCPVWKQLDIDWGSGLTIERGFSGAGVWDPQSGRTVGLIAATFNRRGDARVAWMLPLDAVADQWPALRRQLDVEEDSPEPYDRTLLWPKNRAPVRQLQQPRVSPPPPIPSAPDQLALAKALLAIPQIDDDNGAMLRSLLPPEIRHNVKYQSRPRLHVMEIVRACAQHRGGRAALREAVVLLADETAAAEAALSLLDQLWAMGDGA